MKTKPTDIKGLLRNFKHYTVSSELDAKILKALDNIRVEKEVIGYKPSFFTLLQGYLKSLNRYVAIPVAMLLVFVGGGIYYTQTSYGYHLGNAKTALVELESNLKGNSYQAYIIPAALAEDGNINEEVVERLTHKIVKSTEKAIEIAERIDDPQQFQYAFAEINAVQEKEVEVFIDAAEAIKTEKVAEVVARALENTSIQEESVDKAVEAAKKAVKEKREKIQVDIQTTVDQHEELMREQERQARETIEQLKAERLKKANAQYEAAKVIIEKLKNQGVSAEEIAKLEAQLVKIKTALDEGKINAVYSLTTAIQARGKNILQKIQLKNTLIEKGKEDQNQPEEDKNKSGEDNNKADVKLDTINIDPNKAKELLRIKEAEKAKLLQQAIQKKKEEERLRIEQLKLQKQRIEEALRKKREAEAAAKRLLDIERSKLAPTSGSLTPKITPDTLDSTSSTSSDAIRGNNEPITNQPVEEKPVDGTSGSTDRATNTSTGGISDVNTKVEPEVNIDSAKNETESTPILEYKTPITTDSIKTNIITPISPLKIQSR